jgi:glutathione peroxidase
MSKTFAQLCLVSSLTMLLSTSAWAQTPAASRAARGRACCSAPRQLPGHPEADLQAPAGRLAAGPVPVRGQGDAGGEHGQLLRLHQPVRRAGSLYAKYSSKGLVVLGFPSNDFGQQEPGSSKEIADFCYNTYGVKFPMFAKSVVSGKEPNPLYVNLIKATGKAPAWNFHKYLIDRHGNVVDSFGSKVTPTDKQLVSAVEKALAGPGRCKARHR